MSYTARILVVGQEAGVFHDLAAKLAAFDCEALAADDAAVARAAVADQAPDVVIVDAKEEGTRGGHLSMDQALELIAGLKADCGPHHPPVVLIGPPAGRGRGTAGFAAGASVYLSKPYHDAQLLSRLRSLVRLATMNEELVRRTESLLEFGVDNPNLVSEKIATGESNVLVFAHEAEDCAIIEDLLTRSIKLTFAWSAGTALDYLSAGQYEAVLMEANPDSSDPLVLIGDIRRNSRLFNIPVVAIADRDKLTNSSALFNAGVNDLVYRPLDSIELGARLQSFIYEERYRTAMRWAYRDSRHHLILDGLTEIYSHGFAYQHLGRQIADAGRWGKDLTVAVFNVRQMADINNEYGYACGDRVLRQMGNMIGLVIRGEDMPARISGQEFIVSMPDTSTLGAQFVLPRIKGVLNATEYFVPSRAEPVSARVRAGVASYCDGDSPETLIARARAALI